MIHEILNSGDLTRYPYFEGHSNEVFDLFLDTASKIAQNLLRPVLKIMDQSPPELVDGRVKVQPVVRKFMEVCGEGGWISATAPCEMGGQQLSE
jgi:butyryl-CoA dehydrogenase